MSIDEVVEALIPQLRLLGYRKNKLTWKKRVEDIELYFWVQKSLYSKQDWFYWWGVYVTSIEPAADLKASPYVCQIRFRADNKGLTTDSLIALTTKWEEMYGTRDKLRQAAVQGKLPPLTSPKTISYLLLGDY